MGKAPGGNYETPKQWEPPPEMVNQPGQIAEQPANTTPNFLPDKAGTPANGLTPEMIALILGTQPPELTGRDALAQMLTPKPGEVLS